VLSPLLYTVCMPAPPEPLDFPFFTLEYRDGFFARLIPPDARDLGGGLFRQGKKTWTLPAGGDCAALADACIKGRPLLSLLNRGPNPLIERGPRLARAGERLMELGIPAAGPPAPAGAGPLLMELRLRKAGESEWLPLSALPRHRLYQNVIYEIIDEGTLRELAEYSTGSRSYTLRGEEIPRFADDHGRLIFQFGDRALQAALAVDSVFIPADRLSLILGVVREKHPRRDHAWAVPLLRCGERRYPAEEVSRRMDREYILLDRQWARREDLQNAGLFPLRSYAGGRTIEKIKLLPGELLRRGGPRFAGLFSGMEADTGLWTAQGDRETIFHSHLEFLRHWGLSGGVVCKGRREQAALLAAALIRFAQGGGNTLALMEKRYYELYLPLFLPELAAAPVILPGTGRKTGGALRVVFYEDLPGGPGEERAAAELLVLVEPEEALSREQTLTRLEQVKAEMTLGIFSDSGKLFHGPAAAKARNLFGIQEAELTPYLIRDTALARSLPQFAFPPPRIIRPVSSSAGEGPFTYAVEEKFAGLSGPALYSELALFRSDGPPAPFVPLRLLKGSLDIERMDEGERAFFVYWRGEFRGGNIMKTGETYIRVYARELCLFTGGGSEADGNFRQLLALWESYRDIFESVNSYIPRWLVDFAVLYEIADTAFPLLLPHVQECKDPLLGDIYLYRRFITENNSIELGDIELLIPKLISGGEFSGRERSSAHRRRFIKDFEAVINAADRCLREQFHLRLFEFFYPQVYDTEKREAFADMERAGRSSYTIEGIRFSKHPPLISFLENLFRYTEYCFRLKNGLEPGAKAPPLGEEWKYIAGSALGMEDRALIPAPAEPAFSVSPVLPAAFVSQPPLTLRPARLEKIRADSDAVRDLLRIEDEGESRTARRPPVQTPAKPGKTSLRARKSGFARSIDRKNPQFEQALKGLAGAFGKTEREALRIIAGKGAMTLADFARKHHDMPELLIDRINAAFLEQFGDLLIDTVDEQPRIQREYTEALQKLLGGP
jgi:hypothetical protein